MFLFSRKINSLHLKNVEISLFFYVFILKFKDILYGCIALLKLFCHKTYMHMFINLFCSIKICFSTRLQSSTTWAPILFAKMTLIVDRRCSTPQTEKPILFNPWNIPVHQRHAILTLAFYSQQKTNIGHGKHIIRNTLQNDFLYYLMLRIT